LQFPPSAKLEGQFDTNLQDSTTFIFSRFQRNFVISRFTITQSTISQPYERNSKWKFALLTCISGHTRKKRRKRETGIFLRSKLQKITPWNLLEELLASFVTIFYVFEVRRVVQQSAN
ncbi:MAG TPA: hypothetical protein ACHBZA_03785, partial [Arsenophonus apicola]